MALHPRTRGTEPRIPTPTATSSARPWALPGAAAVAAVEGLVLLGAVVVTGGRAVPLVVALLGLKLAFCVGLAAGRAGAYLTIWLYEAAGALVALTKPHLAGTTRLVELVAATACMALLAAGAAAFPDVRLPRP